MIQILGLFLREFKVMINILKSTITERKAYTTDYKLRRGTETRRKIQVKMLELKNNNKYKKCLEYAKESISEVEDGSLEIIQTKIQGEQMYINRTNKQTSKQQQIKPKAE
jgi:hypothetical protein